MKEFLLNPNLLIPFLSTISAALTIIFLHFIQRYINDRKKKLYAIAYMVDVSFKLLYTNLLLQNNTILPHIEASKRMISGDQDLLDIMFSADEFDILTDNIMGFSHLPEEYKILIGYDDIKLLQEFETILYLNRNDKTGKNFNEFVKQNLKSETLFKNKNHDEQIDILKIYGDYLDKIKHETNRVIASVFYLFLPSIREYIDRKYFLFCSKRNITTILERTTLLQEKFKGIIPESNFFEKSIQGGIQKIIKK
jgi:hypothetical protein